MQKGVDYGGQRRAIRQLYLAQDIAATIIAICGATGVIGDLG